MSSFQQLISNSIALLEGQQNTNVSGALSEFLQSQGLNMNEIWQPSVDILENNDNVTVYMNISGVNNDSIDVDFFNERVVVTGERKRPFSDEMTVVKNEIIYGKFERHVNLPISVTNRDSVKISSNNGVLVIVIDKRRDIRNRFSLRVPSTSSSIEDPE
jgi:HSP20 family molecular chaperone IbpA